MSCGAGFPDIYDWTWGEAVDFINAHDRHRKEELRTQALMDMTQLSTLARIMSGNAGQLRIMDVYKFLWTDRERVQAKADRLRAQLEAKSKGGGPIGG